MTDKEIIKVLECCLMPGECGACPYNNGDLTDCVARICRDALYLITSQQSQIEDLKEALEERIERIKKLEAEIKQLKERLDAKCDICIERERTAAIGKFAWRLKLLLTPYPDCDFKEPVTSKQIDTLVKEMTEDES